jgi:hypothetical protein
MLLRIRPSGFVEDTEIKKSNRAWLIMAKIATAAKPLKARCCARRERPRSSAAEQRDEIALPTLLSFSFLPSRLLAST